MTTLILGTEFLSDLLLALFSGKAFVVSLQNPLLGRARLSHGIVLCLSLKLVGTLLASIEVHGWNAIGHFMAVVALRSFLKWGAKFTAHA